MRDFYRSVLGLTLTDEELAMGFVFLSSRPDEEHHELLLYRSADYASSLQQISFRVSSLEDVLAFAERFREEA